MYGHGLRILKTVLLSLLWILPAAAPWAAPECSSDDTRLDLTTAGALPGDSLILSVELVSVGAAVGITRSELSYPADLLSFSFCDPGPSTQAVNGLCGCSESVASGTASLVVTCFTNDPLHILDPFPDGEVVRIGFQLQQCPGPGAVLVRNVASAGTTEVPTQPVAPICGLDGRVACADTDGDMVLDDGDGSGVVGDAPCAPGIAIDCDDNCPFTPNPDQADDGGLLSMLADGIGNVCQCGELDGNGVIDAGDVAAFRSFLADPNGAALTPEADERCTVIGSAGICDLLDVTVLRRAVEGPQLPPGLAQICAAASAP